jgi:hypothetical protein
MPSRIIEIAAWATFVILVARWVWSQDVAYEPWSLVCGGVGCGLELYRGYTWKASAHTQGLPRRRWRVTISGLLGLIALLAVLLAQVRESARREAMESARREAIKIATARARRRFPMVRWQDLAVDAKRVEPAGTWMVVIAPKSGARTNTYKVQIREDRITEWGSIHPAAKSRRKSSIKPLVGD